MSGTGSLALNATLPSPLDENRLEYRIRLTADLLPEMEELLIPGPLQEEIKIQVRRNVILFNAIQELLPHCNRSCNFVMIFFFLTADLSQIRKRIWGKNKSEHKLPVLRS